jgi:S-adenosylmethionine:tRNA ribosyltransferase-isomerase
MGPNDENLLSSYDYVLPPSLVAQKPAEPRDSSRLMVLRRDTAEIVHSVFCNIGQFLKSGDLLVLNDTKVIPARVFGRRSTGGKVEALFVREIEPGQWEIMLKAGGKLVPGEVVGLADGRLPMRLLRRSGTNWLAAAPKAVDVIATLEERGETPLPPYIERSATSAEEAYNRQRYQTIYARERGAIAAPTAGLHFTPDLLASLRAAGIRTTQVTLHVGIGTFRPVVANDIRQHVMHAEFYRIPADAGQAVSEAESAKRRVIAVGTTACRVLESAGPGALQPGDGWTSIFIHPPYGFHHTRGLLTNFHLPRSTLLMLVSAFAGRERLLKAYEEAVSRQYRFYSYGDAMLII